MDGTRKRTDPPAPAMDSAMRRLVAEAGEGLSGSAGHDHLAATGFLETEFHVSQRSDLVRTQLLGRWTHQRVWLGQYIVGPVNGRLSEIIDADAPGLDLLVDQGIGGVPGPLVCGGDDHAAGEWVLARGGEERVDVALLDRVSGVEELALDRAIPVAIEFLSDEVDAGVDLPVASRPVLPKPDFLELRSPYGIGCEVGQCELLEQEALFAGIASQPCILVQ